MEVHQLLYCIIIIINIIIIIINNNNINNYIILYICIELYYIVRKPHVQCYVNYNNSAILTLY